ncbi:MAG: cytochrome c biogenesis protein [Zetaproteobacteria bacterium CG2_30_46_52]|nr:MAG: cytochrome c biogenesis protein [Zetaproteobacteria bacterium CG2_30_46_52]
MWLCFAPMFSFNQTLKPLLTRFGSMPVAILLLVLLAVASVIGTVLKQNQDQADYLHQFGPVWYWTFRALGLFDMYHTWWFLTILGLLMASLGACLYRNVPRFLQEMRNRKGTLSDNARKHMEYKFDVTFDDKDKAVATVKSSLPDWKWLETESAGTLWLRGDKGRFHKWGYISVHTAMLVILVGGWMSVQFGFRGNMAVPEGASENEISYLRGTGVEYLKMPFEVRCDEFSINFFSTGAPSEFRSKLTILEDGKEMMSSDIIVNEPLYYKGVRIYQASFGDGGSDIKMNLFRLNGEGTVDVANTKVYTKFEDPYSDVSMEIRDFRPYNIENMAAAGKPKKFKDMGPSVDFVIRGKGLKPVLVRSFMEPFYLEDNNQGSMIMISKTGDARDFETYMLGLDFSNKKEWALFQSFLNRLPRTEGATQQDNLAAFRAALDEVYPDGRPDDLPMLGNRVIQSMQVLPDMPWPFVPILDSFDQTYYTGLQLAKDPGMDVVWIGSAILVFGLCIMFYVAHRKVWIKVVEDEGKVTLQVTGLSNRNPVAFEQEFEDLKEQINTAYKQGAS